MQRRRFIQLMGTSAVALGAGSVLSACKSKSDGDIRPYMRFINLVPNYTLLSPSLSVTSNFGALTFQQNSGYQQVDWAGSYTATIKDSGGNVVGSSYTTVASQKSHNTTYLYPGAAGVQHYALQDDTPTVSSGNFTLRAFVASSSMGPYDIYVTDAAHDTLTTAATASSTVTGMTTLIGVTANTFTAYSSEQTAGTLRVRVMAAGTLNAVFDSSIAFSGGNAYTLVLYSVGSAQLPTALLVTPNSDNVQTINNAFARIRVAQGVVPATAGTTSTVNLDGSVLYQAVPFGGVSDYSAKAAGSHTVTLALNGGTYATATANFVGGHDYTVYFSGTQGAASAFVLEDSGLPVTTTRVRFVNAASDQTSDVLVSYVPKVSSLLPGKDSLATDLAAGTLPISFVVTGSTTELGSFGTTGVTLASGGAYSVALLGGGGTYTAVQFKTN